MYGQKPKKKYNFLWPHIFCDIIRVTLQSYFISGRSDLLDNSGYGKLQMGQMSGLSEALMEFF